jgi:hypothetical protein
MSSGAAAGASMVSALGDVGQHRHRDTVPHLAGDLPGRRFDVLALARRGQHDPRAGPGEPARLGGATLTGMVPDSLPGEIRAKLLDPEIIVPPLPAAARA